MTDVFAALASRHDLEDRAGRSPEGLPERYLYSRDMRYRYAFGRWWGAEDLATSAVWVLLNPATGDTERRRRPTLERCIARSLDEGHTGLVIVNLFAFRGTNPRNLRTTSDPVGPANDDVLGALTSAGARTIVAWGAHGRLGARSGHVAPLLDSPMCLGTTKRREPRHPLYVSAEAPLMPWHPARPETDPDDGEFRRALLRATPAATERLRAAIAAIRACRGRDAQVAWSRMSGRGSTEDPLVLSYPAHSKEVMELLEALEEVHAQPAFSWPDWDGSGRYADATALADAPVADAMRLVTSIVRGERFSAGTIAQALADGRLVAAAERILTELSAHPWGS